MIIYITDASDKDIEALNNTFDLTEETDVWEIAINTKSCKNFDDWLQWQIDLWYTIAWDWDNMRYELITL